MCKSKYVQTDMFNYTSEELKALNNCQNSAGLNISGAKDDTSKPDMSLVLDRFAGALIEVAKVGTFGARKYTEDGWLHVPNGQRRYRSALLRHHFYEAEGEEFDSDSGLSHKAHRAWNALAELQLYLNEGGNKNANIKQADD